MIRLWATALPFALSTVAMSASAAAPVAVANANAVETVGV